MTRRKKTAYSKFRAKAVKSVREASKSLSKSAKRARKTVGKSVKKLETTRRRATKRAAKVASKTVRKTRTSANKARRTLARKTKKTIRAVKRFTRSGKQNAGRVLRSAKKAIRARKKQRSERERIKKRALKAAERARTRRELGGQVSLEGAVLVESPEDPGASRPGEPPKRRTGKGQSSIKAELFRKGRQLKSRVFVDKKIAPYMALWEFRNDGQQRPFLKPTIDHNMHLLGKIIGTELRKLATAQPKKKAKVN